MTDIVKGETTDIKTHDEAWIRIQHKTFTNWCNESLKSRDMVLNDLLELDSGVALVNLIEILAEKFIGARINKAAKLKIQKCENLTIALNFLKNEGIKLVNIGPEDIADKNLKIILGLIWTLILQYQIHSAPGGSMRQELLEWVQSKVGKDRVNNFSTDWNDGTVLCELIDAIDRGACPDAKSLNKNDALANATKGTDLAEKRLDIPCILSPEDMVNPDLDELSNFTSTHFYCDSSQLNCCMTYISYFRDANPKSASDPSKVKAEGPGLEGGRAGEPAPFKITNPDNIGKIKVFVEGPNDPAKVEVTNHNDGTYDVVYHPTEPGDYYVSVTLDDDHIPGSKFHVKIDAELSLGGEGKIRVYYSSTTSQAKIRKDTHDFQILLADKKIHERPDFEPWIAVDIMEKEQRDIVWAKAGHRRLPMFFVNDSYIGDYDTCVQLDNQGKLDDLLNYGKLGNVNLEVKENSGPGYTQH